MEFQPDYNNILNAALNKRPDRLPLYEHIISPVIMEKITGDKFADLLEGNSSDVDEFFANYCRFFKEMTYDTVSFEVCITSILPDGGALLGGKLGPIQCRSDFDKYPWQQIPDMFWDRGEKMLDSMVKNMPEGMKAIGGVGNGVFEISEDMVGLEHLAYMQIDDPQLFDDLYSKIGDLMSQIWSKFLEKYSGDFVVCRFGDDLGFKSGTLTSPPVIRNNIIPQYKRIVDLVKSHKKPFLWHSCGNIFEVMEDVISIGINAKHSNEDAIAPFDKWIELYGGRIGLFGGIDVDLLCTKKPDEIVETVFKNAKRFRANANGFALGSGNSIPDYVPTEGFLAMVEAAKKVRQDEV
jgi:uroporphyrinogen decarboxylase